MKVLLHLGKTLLSRFSRHRISQQIMRVAELDERKSPRTQLVLLLSLNNSEEENRYFAYKVPVKYQTKINPRLV